MEILIYTLLILQIFTSCNPSSKTDDIVQIYYRSLPHRSSNTRNGIDTTWMKTDLMLVFNDSTALNLHDPRAISQINDILKEKLSGDLTKYFDGFHDLKVVPLKSGEFILRENSIGTGSTFYQCTYDANSKQLFSRRFMIMGKDTSYITTPLTDSLGVFTYSTVETQHLIADICYPTTVLNPKTSLVVPQNLIPIDERYENEIRKYATFKLGPTNVEEIKQKYLTNQFVVGYMATGIIGDGQFRQTIWIVDDSLKLMVDLNGTKPLKYRKTVAMDKNRLNFFKSNLKFQGTRQDSIPFPTGKQAALMHLLLSKIDGKYSFGGILEPFNIPSRLVNRYGTNRVVRDCIELSSTLTGNYDFIINELVKEFPARDSILAIIKNR